MAVNPLNNDLHTILQQYQKSFSEKAYDKENNDEDLLMKLFNLTPQLKRENRQYWGRELGMCWQLIVTKIFEFTRTDFAPPQRFGSDEPADFFFDKYAVDTKYRIGSGDSGTLKKFKSYGHLLRAEGYIPVFLILRDDNLPAAINACKVGMWEIFTGNGTLDFINTHTKFDLEEYLTQKEGDYEVVR